MRGRKPKAPYLRVLDGNADRREKDENLETPQPEKILDSKDPPAWMNALQARIWREAIGSAPDGMLRSLDASVMEGWVISRYWHQKATEEANAKEFKPVLEYENGGQYMNPTYAIINKQAEKMVRFASELGFSPVSRSRVKVERKKSSPSTRSPFSSIKDDE